MAAGGTWPDDDGGTANWPYVAQGHVGPYCLNLELVEEPRPAQAWACLAKDRFHNLAHVSFQGFGAAEPPIPGLRKGAVLRWRSPRCSEVPNHGDLFYEYVSKITPEDLPNLRLLRYASAGADGDDAGGADGTTGPDGREVFWEEVLEASPRALLGAYIEVLIADNPDPKRNWRCAAEDKATKDEAAGEGLGGLLSFPGSSPLQPPLPELRKGAVLRWRNPRCLGRLPFDLLCCAPIAAEDLRNVTVQRHTSFFVKRGGVVVHRSLGSVRPPVLQAPPRGAAGPQPAAAGASRARPTPSKSRGQAQEQEPLEPMSAREWAINICMGLLVVAIAIFFYNSGDGATRGRS